MKFIPENQGGNIFLTYTLGPGEVLDKTTLGMITNNKIYGLAPAVYAQIEGQSVIKYNVSSKIQAKRLMTGKVSKKVLLGVFLSICRVFSEIEDYMIPAETVLLDLERIYVDAQTCEAVLLCLPLEREDAQNADLRLFFRNTMFSSVFDDQEDNSYVAEIISYLNGSANFVVSQFEAIVRKASRPASPAAQSGAPAYVPPAAPPAPPAPQPPAERNPIEPIIKAGIAKWVGGTDAGGVGKTVAAEPMPPEPAESFREKPPVAPGKKPFSFDAPPAEPARDEPFREHTFDGMAVPDMGWEEEAPAAQTGADPDDKISLMHLLRHMDKETLAAYKAQQAEKKQNKPPKPEKKGKKKKKQESEEDFVMDEVPVFVPDPAVFRENASHAPGQPPFTPEAVAPTLNQWQAPAPAHSATMETIHTLSGAYGQDDAEERTIFGGDLADISMLEEEIVVPILIRKATGERIQVNRESFQIGRSQEEADYCISDNKKIGRKHARIISRNGMYFVVDQESKNGTYINGEKLPSGVEVELHAGDILSIFTEKFEFETEQ